MNNEQIEKNGEMTPTEKKPKRKGNVIFSVLTLFFCVLIFGVGVINIIEPDKAFSDSENRVLSQLPSLSFHSITDGSFMKDFETYLTDQFPLRDKLISLKAFFDRLSGKKEVSGVYIGDDGYLFSKPAEFNETQVSEITSALSAFSEKNKNAKKAIMIAPDAGFIYSDKLPDKLDFPKQDYQLDDIRNYIESESLTWIDTADVLKGASSAVQLYYKTDHHWTTRGAYEAFAALMSAWKIDISKVQYNFFTVSTDFEGTLGSKTGIHSAKDSIEICVPAEEKGSYVVSFDSQQRKTASLFENSKLSEKNQYEVFLGGNFDKITITTVSQSKDTLLLIKDSYANCMIPMLTPYFNKIVIVDPRYFTDSLSKIIDENGFSHILFLYNLNTFLEDVSLVKCLES